MCISDSFDIISRQDLDRRILPIGEYVVRITRLPGQVEGRDFFWMISRKGEDNPSNYGHGWSASFDEAKQDAQKYLASCKLGG